MPLIIWVDHYNTGIDEIDIQHRKLVGLINTLFDIISKKDRKDLLNQALTELVNYTLYHFKLEEDLMLKHKYKEYEIHKKEHVNFVEKVNQFLEKLQMDDNKNLLSIINFLKDWLLKHIMGTDKKYASVIISNVQP